MNRAQLINEHYAASTMLSAMRNSFDKTKSSMSLQEQDAVSALIEQMLGKVVSLEDIMAKQDSTPDDYATNVRYGLQDS